MTSLSIGITTRNRPESLAACLRSVRDHLGTRHDVLVFDDASDAPAAAGVASTVDLPLRVVRDERGVGYIAGRNALMREARHELVLLLDDDARLLDGEAIARAVEVMEHDRTVAAVAFAQAETDGSPWPDGMQAGRGGAPSVVASYIGFAHLLRRSVFLALGGYRDRLVFYGEEREYCIRLLHLGHRVVYLPEARIAHVPDPAARDRRRYVRYAVRNDCLSSLYTDPWPWALATLPLRLARHRRMAAGIPGGDPGGLRWLLRELRREFPFVRRERQAVSWATLRRWRQVREGQPYR